MRIKPQPVIRGLKIIALFFSIFFLLSKPALAQGNKYGIHILNPSELDKASALVNSGGGDWGYVTIVIRDDEREQNRWQQFFDSCREKHIIPIVRIATHQGEGVWIKPDETEIDLWANFLNSLNWPVKNQYVVISNEPNHAAEWGGALNPREYARFLNGAITAFKDRNPNFQVLNAGFDLAAPNSKTTMEALNYWQQMNQEVPGIFDQLDGWVSHSYPNHGYVGTPYEQGKTSICGYRWEINQLIKHFGLTKDLPVLITETGWPYKIGRKETYYSQEKAAEFINYAYEKVWILDKQVVAVTPFLLSYDQEPFNNFSWIDNNGQTTAQFEKVKSTAKTSEWPDQEFKFSLESIIFSSLMPTESAARGIIVLKNTGQSIWGEKDLSLFTPTSNQFVSASPLGIPSGTEIKPGEEISLEFKLFSSTAPGDYTFSWNGLPEYKIKVLPSTLLTKARIGIWENVILSLKRKLLH